MPSANKSKTRRRKERPAENFADETVADWEQRMWKKRVPPVVTFLAKAVAYVAGVLAEFVDAITRGEAGRLAEDFDRDVWEACYRDDKKLLKLTYRRVRKNLGPLREFALVARGLKRVQKMLADGEITAEEICEFLNVILNDEELQTSAIQFREEFQAEFQSILEDAIDGKFELIEDTYTQFFVTVWIPSMCLYGCSPESLFRLASGGDKAAIHKLIRLDRDVQYIPVIRDIISGWERERIRYRFELEALDDARRDCLGSFAEPTQYKLAAIKFIIGHSKRLCEFKALKIRPMTTIDLRHLFDAITREQNNGNLIDHDLPDSDEALRKAMQRKRPVKFASEGWDKFAA